MDATTFTSAFLFAQKGKTVEIKINITPDVISEFFKSEYDPFMSTIRLLKTMLDSIVKEHDEWQGELNARKNV